MLVVKKFGGSSVANSDRIKNVAKRCVEDYQQGNDVIVVLSAMGDTTDELLELAKSVSNNPSKREMDMLLTTGEQTSVALLAMAIDQLGVPAISLNGFQVSMHATSRYSDGRFKRIDTARIDHELEAKKIVIITGFQGINQYDDYVTLGRGGSDTTAVALAGALRADKCEIYTDVDGVYIADPRIIPYGKKLEEITYDEMLELASVGAKVLHNRSVEMAKKYGVELVVRSSLNKNEGTIVKERVNMEGMLISGVTGDKKVARVSLLGVKNGLGTEFKIFQVLAKEHINVDLILQTYTQENKRDISFCISEEYLEQALKVLEEKKESLHIEAIEYASSLSKISVVGAGMSSNPDVMVKVFESLFNGGIEIQQISTSEIRITMLIEEEETHRAIDLIYKGLEMK